MRQNFEQGPDFKGTINDGGRPRLQLDAGPTYERFMLKTNVAADEFTFFIEVEGDRRVELTGTELEDMAEYDGRTSTAGYFFLDMTDNLAKLAQGELMSGLTTQVGDRVIVGVDLAASVTEASPTLELFYKASGNRPNEFELYILPEHVPITKTGKNPFRGFQEGDFPEHIAIRRFFAYGAITHLSIKRDDRHLFGEGDLAIADNNADLLHDFKVVPTSSTCYVCDPIINGNVILDVLDTFNRKHLEANFTTSNDSDLRVITHYIKDVRPRKEA